MDERISKSAYTTTKLNAEIYDGRKTLGDYFRSTAYFFTPDRIKEGYTFLDIGGASGDFCEAIRNDVAAIVPTVIDPDAVAVEAGRGRDCRFVVGFFPDDLPDEKYDVVSMQALFPQIPDWKAMLLTLSSRARRYVNVSLVAKLHGTTVVDKDVSYFYYLDSGERVHQVVHNLHELVNFLCIYEMNVKRIEFYGYHTPETGHNFRCVPNDEQIKGNLMLELFPGGENPKRVGGAVHKGRDKAGYKFFVPETHIVIDDKPYSLR